MNDAKPASESQTLRENRWFTYIGLTFAAALDIVTVAIDVVTGDPALHNALNDLIPQQWRLLVGAVIIAVAQRNRILRYRTTTPIEPTSQE